jgi:membrane protein
MTALWAQAARKPRPGLSKPEVAAPQHFEEAEPGRGRLAEHPHHIPLKGWKDIVWRTYQEIGRDRLQAVAGGITFYTLLAIVPALGVFVSLYGLFADVETVSKQLNQLAVFVPREVLSLLGEQMMRLATKREAALSVAFLVSLLLSVWSANAGVASLFDGLNQAYDEQEKRNFFVRRSLTYAFTAGMLVFITAITALLVAVPVAVKAVGLSADNAWLIPFRWVVLLALASTFFAIVYRYGPSRQKARWRWVTWGGVLAAMAWVGGSLGFSWYVNNIAHFDATYGSLGAVIGFMMWVWFSVLVVLIGAELNAEIEHQTAIDSTTGAPAPMGQRGAAMADTVGLAFKGVRNLWSDLERQITNLMKRGKKDA